MVHNDLSADFGTHEPLTKAANLKGTVTALGGEITGFGD